MHRCLEVADILRVVFEHAYKEGQLGYGRQATSSLSLGCRFFHQVGSPILWSVLWSRRPLIKCMPGDVWVEELLELEDDEDDDPLNDSGTRLVCPTFI